MENIDTIKCGSGLAARAREAVNQSQDPQASVKSYSQGVRTIVKPFAKVRRNPDSIHK